jgi:hypothetical protein
MCGPVADVCYGPKAGITALFKTIQYLSFRWE